MAEHKTSGKAENSFLGLMYGQYMLSSGIADVFSFSETAHPNCKHTTRQDLIKYGIKFLLKIYIQWMGVPCSMIHVSMIYVSMMQDLMMHISLMHVFMMHVSTIRVSMMHACIYEGGYPERRRRRRKIIIIRRRAVTVGYQEQDVTAKLQSVSLKSKLFGILVICHQNTFQSLAQGIFLSFYFILYISCKV